MSFKRYHAVIIAILCSFLTTTSCEEDSTLQNTTKNSSLTQPGAAQSSTPITGYSFDGSEGDPITLDVATRWVSNFSNLNPDAPKATFFRNDVIQNLLAKPGCLGIRIYYSLDDTQQPNLLLVGTDGQGNNLMPLYGIKGTNSLNDLTKVSDADISLKSSPDDSLSTDIYRRWTAAYKQNNPTKIQAHFFGYQIINNILDESGSVGIRIYYALNDSGVQQLLLIGTTEQGQNLLPESATGGRVEGDIIIGDASWPCPSYCSGN